MSKEKKKKYLKSNSKYFGLKSFILLPISFCIVSIGIIIFSVGPIISPIFSSLELFLSVSGKTKPVVGQNLLNNTQINSLQPSTINRDDITLPSSGDEYANIKIEGTTVDSPVLYNDTPAVLNIGIGTYTGTWLPGFGHTILMGGHNNTWFSDLKSAQEGSTITVTTYYGIYTYKVTGTAVKNHTDTSAYDLAREDENIVLYTCYPFDTIGITPDRFFVYGEYVSGPVVVND